MPTPDTFTNFRFRVETDGLTISDFSEVLLGGAMTEVVELREGSDASAVRKVPGITRYATVTLKRGLTASLELYQWHRLVVERRVADARRNVAVVLFDETMTEVARFVLHNAWPTKYEVGTLTALDSAIVTETLELTHDGLERVA